MARHDQQNEWLHPRRTKRTGRWMQPLQRTDSAAGAARRQPERRAVCGGVLGEKMSGGSAAPGLEAQAEEETQAEEEVEAARAGGSCGAPPHGVAMGAEASGRAGRGAAAAARDATAGGSWSWGGWGSGSCGCCCGAAKTRRNRAVLWGVAGKRGEAAGGGVRTQKSLIVRGGGLRGCVCAVAVGGLGRERGGLRVARRAAGAPGTGRGAVPS